MFITYVENIFYFYFKVKYSFNEGESVLKHFKLVIFYLATILFFTVFEGTQYLLKGKEVVDSCVECVDPGTGKVDCAWVSCGHVTCDASGPNGCVTSGLCGCD